MKFRVISADEFGHMISVEDGEDTVIHNWRAVSSEQCRTVLGLLRQPGLPNVEFVCTASRSKIDGRRQYSFVCRGLADGAAIEFGWSGYFGSDAELRAVIEHLRAAPRTLKLVGRLPAPRKPVMTTKKTAKKITKVAAKETAAKKTGAKKTAAKAASTGRKQLVAIIADKSGIVPVDVGVTIDCLIKEIVLALRAGGEVKLSELGTFSRVDGEAVFKFSSAFTGQLE